MASHEQTRMGRLHDLKEAIDEFRERGTYNPENRKKLIAEACMKWGSTRRKILEYLDIVEAV